MVKLKRVLLVLLVVVLMAGIVPVFAAQARYGTKNSRFIETTGMLTDQDGNSMTYPVWIYSISIYADATNSFMGVYDTATAVALCNTEYARDEIGEATQFDVATRVYAKPQYYAEGVGAIITTGCGSVEYGSEPKE